MNREVIADLLDRIETELAPSFVQVLHYDADDYIRQFCLDHLEDIDSQLFVETEESFPEVLLSWGRDSESLRRLAEATYTEGKIVRFANEPFIFELLSGTTGTTFYILEDLFFLKGEKDVWCFMLGNNE